jgi:Na+/H+-dicarboxylate symporter
MRHKCWGARPKAAPEDGQSLARSLGEVRSKSFVLYGIAAGAVAGGLLGWASPDVAVRFGFLGDFFLKALRMIVAPLIISSMIVGVTSMGDLRKAGRVGARTIMYFLTTTLFAVTIGLVMVLTIQPGVGATPGVIEEAAAQKATLVDLLLSLVPSNIFDAASGTQMLAVITFSIFFAACLSTLGERGKIVVDFFDGVNEVVLRMAHIIFYIAPIGIFGLVAAKLGSQGGAAFGDVLLRLGKYSLTVCLGLCTHGLLVLPSLALLVGRFSPAKLFGGVNKALLTAFATASSSATLPVTIDCADATQIDRRVSRFVLPVGATINMDGTALYEAVAAIFIAQAYGIALGPIEVVTISLTATLAAVGAAGIPEAGLVTMVMVLDSVGLPTEGIGLILAVDWLLDRFRTTVNVWGDCVGTTLVQRLSLRDLQQVAAPEVAR